MSAEYGVCLSVYIYNDASPIVSAGCEAPASDSSIGDGSGGAGGLPDASTASFPVEDIYIARPTRWEIINSSLEHRGVISTWPSRKEFMATAEGLQVGIVASYEAALDLIKEYWAAG